MREGDVEIVLWVPVIPMISKHLLCGRADKGLQTNLACNGHGGCIILELTSSWSFGSLHACRHEVCELMPSLAQNEYGKSSFIRPSGLCSFSDTSRRSACRTSSCPQPYKKSNLIPILVIAFTGRTWPLTPPYLLHGTSTLCGRLGAVSSTHFED